MVPPLFWVISTTLFGAIIGSFLNMLSYRVPRNISLVERSRSFCPTCKAQLAWYENLPLLSYLFLMGRCLHCRAPIGVRYFLIEVVVTVLFYLAAYQFFCLNSLGLEPPVLFVVQLFVIADMVFLSVCDLELWLIPIESTLWWIPAAFILGAIFPELHLSMTVWTGNARLDALIDSFAGLVIGSGILWAVGFSVIALSFYWFRIRGQDERPIEGMGEGDMHLMALIGALLGWKPALETIAISLFFGCTIGLAKKYWDRFQRHRLGDKWKPWKPAFDLPPDATAADLQPLLWPPLALGTATVIVDFILYSHTRLRPGGASLEQTILLIVMAAFGAMQIIAYLFYCYLKKIDRLPKMEVEETAEGVKQEVMEAGNYTYMPFGPSLALAAILVVFFDPLIRPLVYWGFIVLPQISGPLRPPPIRPPPFRVLFENNLINIGTALMKMLNDLSIALGRILSGR